MSESKEFTVSEVIDSFGINGHTWLMFILLGLANIFDGYDFMVVNSTNTYLAASFGLIDWSTGAAVVNSAALGSLTTWGLLGMVLGGACGGIMSDKLGRKKMLIIACFFYGIFTLPQAFSQSLGFFAAFRLIAGFGVGSCIPVVTTCFSETIPSKHRGVFVTFGMAFMVAGWVLAGLVAGWICGHTAPMIEGWCAPIKIANGTETFENWRICYMIGALPVLYAIALIFLMHETPHWYANNGQNEKAVEALKILAKNAGRLDEAEHLDPNALVIPPKPSKTSVNILFSKKFIVGTAAIWTTYFVGQFCVYGMNAWIPTWFQGVGYTAQQSVMLQTWNNVAAIASNVTVGFVSDRIGRKKNLCLSWILCIVAIILCSVFIVDDPEQTKFVLYIILMLLFGFCLNYAITAVQPLMPEQYPTALRNTGVAWCQAFARFGGSAHLSGPRSSWSSSCPSSWPRSAPCCSCARPVASPWTSSQLSPLAMTPTPAWCPSSSSCASQPSWPCCASFARWQFLVGRPTPWLCLSTSSLCCSPSPSSSSSLALRPSRRTRTKPYPQMCLAA